MYSASFGSIAVTHSLTVKRRMDGTVMRGEPGCARFDMALDEGVHLHRPGKEATPQPKRPAATFGVVVW